MSDTQANTIRDLLLAALYKYDPNIKTDVGSRAYKEVVDPVYNALLPDLLDTDLDTYLLNVLQQQYPSLELQEGDLVVDLFIKPLRLILEPIKTELALLKKRQSVSYVEQLTLDDAEDLASNFFVTRHNGARARGTVRVLLSTPSFLSITEQVRFSTTSGLVFYPARQEFISVETVALQQIGTLYFVDIVVIAEQEGEEYNILPNEIASVEGIPGFVSVTNPFSFEQGQHSETKEELLSRVEQSLTERSLTSQKGITARINDEFPNIVASSIIGFGDPEMQRDVLTGSGDGFLLASGMSFIVGRFLFMLTGYENNKNGLELPSPGDKVKLNFWKFMYTETSVEDNEIEKVIYCSYGDANDLPTVHILQLKHDITRQPVSGGFFPGTYLGVFTSIFSDATITISGQPNSVYADSLELETSIKSNKVHIGGKYDVWIRPSTVEPASSPISILKSPDAFDDTFLFSDGDGIDVSLNGKYPLNRLGTPYILETPSHSLYLREPIRNQNGIFGFVSKVEPGRLTITCRTGSFSQGDTLTGVYSQNSTIVSAVVFTPADRARIGAVITDTETSASFKILAVFENYYIVHTDIVTERSSIPVYFHRTTGVRNVFKPEFKVFPELAEYAADMQTFTGRDVVTMGRDLHAEGVTEGDTLHILSGQDIGSYTIQAVKASVNYTEVTISSTLSRTNSYVKYRIIREEPPISSPLINILASGVTQSAVNGAGYTIPYKKPVGAYALGAFSGSIEKYEGRNGFVLPNMPPTFKGSGAYVADINLQADPAFLSQFSNAKVDDCISEGCAPCGGLPVTCTVTIDGAPDTYQAVHFYITGLLSSEAKTWITSLRNWLLSLIQGFFKGQNSQMLSLFDDLTAFVDLFAPITFGQPPLNENVVKQFELCLPTELFDGCNNTYLAIPEFNWEAEFASVSTFAEAINSFLSGRMRAQPTALRNAKPGDSLHIRDGANLGEYVIDKVINIPWYHGDTVATEVTVDENGLSSVSASLVERKAYDLSVVVIRGEFPNEALKGSGTYFSSGTIPLLTSLFPSIPTQTLNAIETIEISTGTRTNPFAVIEEAYTVVFKTMYAQGFDLPESFSLQPATVLSKLVRSLFSTYSTGTRSPQQTTRVLFQDPIDVTVYSPQVCQGTSWPLLIHTPPSVTGVGLTVGPLPIPQMSGATVTVYVTENSSQTATTFTGTVDQRAGTTTDIDEFVTYILDALDPTRSILSLTYTAQIGAGQSTRYVFTLSMLRGGEGSALKVDTTSAMRFLNFRDDTIARGTSVVGQDTDSLRISAHNGTRFSFTSGVTNMSLVVDAQTTEDYYGAILPRATASLYLLDENLPRDLVFSSHVSASKSCTGFFTSKDGESCLEAGVLPGDLLYVYEQVEVLDNTGVTSNPFSTKKDRLLHVVYNNARRQVMLLNTAGTFLTPESTTQNGEPPEQDVVLVGDLVVFEDTDEVARVTRVGETVLTLDTAVSAEPQLTILVSGNLGSVNQAQFRSVEYEFTPNDIGNYVVVYGSENTGVDGTYSITAVASGEATLSETFGASESNLHWYMIRPVFNEIGSSYTEGFSATLGTSPIRIYRGTPSVFTIGKVNNFLARDKSTFDILYGNVDGGPRRGVKQPFKILRPNQYRITAKQMEAQGKVSGLYYFDVPTTTLTPSFDLNIPENTQYTPVLSTLSSSGYYLKTKSIATVYSTLEECSLIIDSSYIPSTLSGSLAETQISEKTTINIDYTTSPEASLLQSFLESEENRNLCSDPLVRHFLPSYVMLEVTGGALNDTAVDNVVEYINSLSATESIRLSSIEKRLHQANIDVYAHPMFIHCLTHDLNRDIILTRSNDVIDDTTILHDGTNRITYFIASSDLIKVGELL